MGIEPYLVASSLEVVLAQRLVRLICPHCKEAARRRRRATALRAEFGERRAGRCSTAAAAAAQCQGTGYRGRSGIFELMPVTEEIRALILERASAGDDPQGGRAAAA